MKCNIEKITLRIYNKITNKVAFLMELIEFNRPQQVKLGKYS